MSNSRSGACWPSMLISIDYLGAGALVVCTLHWQTISLVNVRVAVSAICIHLSHAFVPFFFFFSVLENSIESIHLNCFNSYWSDDFPKDELDLNCKWGLSWFLSIWARNEEKCWSSLVLIWWINDGTGQHTLVTHLGSSLITCCHYNYLFIMSRESMHVKCGAGGCFFGSKIAFLFIQIYEIREKRRGKIGNRFLRVWIWF